MTLVALPCALFDRFEGQAPPRGLCCCQATPVGFALASERLFIKIGLPGGVVGILQGLEGRQGVTPVQRQDLFCQLPERLLVGAGQGHADQHLRAGHAGHQRRLLKQRIQLRPRLGFGVHKGNAHANLLGDFLHRQLEPRDLGVTGAQNLVALAQFTQHRLEPPWLDRLGKIQPQPGNARLFTLGLENQRLLRRSLENLCWVRVCHGVFLSRSPLRCF
ncbi:hypothetical protein D3C81_570270 [compost metagenome]